MTLLLAFTSLAATWQRCSKEAENSCVRNLNLPLSLCPHGHPSMYVCVNVSMYATNSLHTYPSTI